MPYCPKCTRKLTKRKKVMEYHCLYHGFVREIQAVFNVLGLSDKDINTIARNFKKAHKPISINNKD